MDDDDEINRILGAELWAELPGMANNAEDDSVAPRFDDLEGSEWL